MKKQRSLSLLSAACLCLFTSTAAVAQSSVIVKPSVINENHPLSSDIYDKSNPDFDVLQSPSEVLLGFPRDMKNRIDWMEVINNKMIQPRANLDGTGKSRRLNTDIIMKQTKGMPYVTFPHSSHTKWLDCSNCHDKIFKAEVNGSPVNMSDILHGKYCGTCHGKVAFPANEACERCHNVAKPGQKAWW